MLEAWRFHYKLMCHLGSLQIYNTHSLESNAVRLINNIDLWCTRVSIGYISLQNNTFLNSGSKFRVYERKRMLYLTVITLLSTLTGTKLDRIWKHFALFWLDYKIFNIWEYLILCGKACIPMNWVTNTIIQLLHPCLRQFLLTMSRFISFLCPGLSESSQVSGCGEKVGGCPEIWCMDHFSKDTILTELQVWSNLLLIFAWLNCKQIKLV